MARRKLMPGRIQLWGHQIAVDWAEPEIEVDERNSPFYLKTGSMITYQGPDRGSAVPVLARYRVDLAHLSLTEVNSID